MKRGTAAFLPAWLAGVVVSATAADLAVMEINHRLPEDIVRLITPLLEPGETVIPDHSQLILKASPARINEILSVVRELDKNRHRLLITVAQGKGLTLDTLNARAGLQAHADPNHPGNLRYSGGGHSYQTESRDWGDSTQRVQTVDGETAELRFGQQLPLTSQSVASYGAYGPIGQQPPPTSQSVMGYGSSGPIGQQLPPTSQSVAGSGSNGASFVSQGVQYREASTGFSVLPRLTGDRVLIEVTPWSDRLSREGGGLIDSHSAHMTVNASLNEWVEIGGQLTNREQHVPGTVGHRYSTRNETDKLFLKVEDLDHDRP